MNMESKNEKRNNDHVFRVLSIRTAHRVFRRLSTLSLRISFKRSVDVLTERKQEDWNKFFGNTLGPNIFWPLLCCHEGPKKEKIWGWKKGKNFTLYIPFWDRESSKPSDSNNKRLVWCWRLYHGTDCSLPHCAPVFQGFPIHLTSSKKGNKNIYSADLRSIQIWKINARYRYLD